MWRAFKILAGRQTARQELRESAPPCLPMELIEMPATDFVSLASAHKVRLRSAFREEFLSTICRRHKELVEDDSPGTRLLSQLKRPLPCMQLFSKSWVPCGPRFRELMQFSARFAALIMSHGMMPTTSRVESDFSLLCYRRNLYSSGLTDFALEGVMYAKEFGDLQKAAKELE